MTLATAAELSAVRLPPAAGLARQLVVVLHGYGADGNDLAPVAQAWREAVPHAAFALPHAPLAMPGGWGRAWFALNLRDSAELAAGGDAAAIPLAAFIEAELARLGLPPTALALAGFSQGAIMALHAGLRRAPAPAAILGYSGLLIAPERLAGEITGRPPTLLVHGDADEVVPPEMLELAAAGLRTVGVAVEQHMTRGLGHGIDGDGLTRGGAFLARHVSQL